MRAPGRRTETACMRNLPYLSRVAAVVAMVVVAGLLDPRWKLEIEAEAVIGAGA